MTTFDPSRRKFIQTTAVTSGAVIVAKLTPEAEAKSVFKPQQATQPANVNIFLRVNGSEQQLMIDTRMTLLDTLR